MRFHKMNGAGNDFIILSDPEGRLTHEEISRLARRLCERHLSIGADGLMVVTKPTGEGDYKMLFYNSDGSMGEMCGNGARCISRYGYEMGLAGEVQRIETTAGLVIGQRIDRRNYRIRLNDPSVINLAQPVDCQGERIESAYVELGDPGIPHAVVHIPGLREKTNAELFDLGRALRYHKAYPKGANVNFYDIIAPDHVLVRTYERGVEDFTYACGTGSGSVITALTLQGLVSGDNIRVEVPGGDLYVTAERAGDTICDLWLTGPTNMVCEGEITDEEL